MPAFAGYRPEETLYILNAELRHRMTPDRPYKLKVPIEKAALLLKVASEIPLGEKPRLSFQAVRGVFIKHKVRQGETLASIAEKYKTSAEAIRSTNSLSKKHLVAGQRLNVPIRSTKASGPAEKATASGRATNHQVQKGDTLASLSRKYGISVTEIRKINNLKNDTLKIGQTLQMSIRNAEEPQTIERKKADPQGKREKTKPETKPVPGKVSESTTPKQYTVKKGNSLNQISRESNIPLDRLLKLNRMGQNENIHPGQVILIQ
jgi:membrane-bound lytic murein transglycosylase D